LRITFSVVRFFFPQRIATVRKEPLQFATQIISARIANPGRCATSPWYGAQVFTASTYSGSERVHDFREIGGKVTISVPRRLATGSLENFRTELLASKAESGAVDECRLLASVNHIHLKCLGLTPLFFGPYDYMTLPKLSCLLPATILIYFGFHFYISIFFISSTISNDPTRAAQIVRISIINMHRPSSEWGGWPLYGVYFCIFRAIHT